MEKDYSILNLKNENSGSEIEAAVNKLDGIECAVLNFPMRKLKIMGSLTDDIISRMNEVITEIVEEAEVVPLLEPVTKQFEINNLDCAHCGTKVEEAILKLEGVESAVLNFPLKKLRVTAVFSDEMIKLINETAVSVEPDIELIPCFAKESQRRNRIREIVRELDDAGEAEHHHDHEHGECCDHEHEHEEHEQAAETAPKQDHEEPEIVDEYKEILGELYNDEPLPKSKKGLYEGSTVGKYELVEDESKPEEKQEEPVEKPASHEIEPQPAAELVQEEELIAADDSEPEPEPAPVPKYVHVKKNLTSEWDGTVSFDFAQLLLGAEIFIGAAVCSAVSDCTPVVLILYIISYLMLGLNVLKSTVKNLKAKKFFDENFLMTIATVGAFIIGKFPEAVGVMLFYRIGELFEDYAVSKSRKAITETAALKVDEADVLIDGEFRRIPADNIRVGDILRIKVGERIAVDGVVESGKSRIDTAAINGEPVPVIVRAGDPIYSGCINLSEGITLRASASAENSMVSKIAQAVEDASASKPTIERFITKFSKIYTPVVLVIAALTAIIPSIVTGDWHKWIYSALTFLVISCPCALVLSVPLAYFSGIGAASKLGILFKGGSSIEALAKIKAIAFDKTGTLTNGTFSVTSIQSFGVLSNRHLLRICGSCEIASTHPVAESIIEYCKKNKLKLGTPDKVSEIAGRGIEAEISGRTVLCGNEKMMDEYEVTIPKGQRGESGSVVYVAVNGKVEGRIVVSDTVKKTSASAVEKLNAMGIHTIMLTGDKRENASITGQRLGIETSIGELLPEDKLKKIENFRGLFGPVMFVGDGINDGPVLAGADVGGAMKTGSDLAIEAADAVFINSEPEAVVNAKKLADRTRQIAYQNIIFALVIKAAVLILGLLGLPNMWFAVFADSGTAMLLVLNSVRNLSTKKYISDKV
ncbi:MAG: cadmium-translocating P-type ATPase [Ruminococcus sp.]|nr:cadmium-translocating P-type ATPase [Ruminococcus sp.]